MIPADIISLNLLILLCILVSYLDIRYRLINIPCILLFCSITGFLASVLTYGLGTVAVYMIPALVVIIMITAVNVYRVQKGKGRIFGGGDRNVYFTFCLMCPVVCGMPAALVIPAFGMMFAIFAGWLPRIAKSHDERGVPFCLYMSLGVVLSVILNSAAVY